MAINGKNVAWFDILVILSNVLMSFAGDHLRIARLQGSDEANQHSLVSDTPAYSLLQTPGGRQAAATWCDESSGVVWLFAGYGYDEDTSSVEPRLVSDLWMLNTSRLEWQPVLNVQLFDRLKLNSKTNDSYVVPSPRQFSALCGVPGILLVAFGGIGQNNTSLSDTWIFLMNTSTWIRVNNEYSTDIEPASGWTTKFHWCSPDILFILGDSAINGTELWEFSLRTLKWTRQQSFINLPLPLLYFSSDNVIPVTWNKTLYTYHWLVTRSDDNSGSWKLAVILEKWLTIQSLKYNNSLDVKPSLWPGLHSSHSTYEVDCGAALTSGVFNACVAYNQEPCTMYGCYSPDIAEWNSPRIHSSSWFHNGDMYVFGGAEINSKSKNLFNDFWLVQVHTHDNDISILSEQMKRAIGIVAALALCVAAGVIGFFIWRLYDYRWGQYKSQELRIRYTPLKNQPF